MKKLILLTLMLNGSVGWVWAQQKIFARAKEDKSIYRFEVRIMSNRHKNALAPEELVVEITTKRVSDGAILQQKTLIASSESYRKVGEEFLLNFELQRVVVSEVEFELTLLDKRIGSSVVTKVRPESDKQMDFRIVSNKKDRFYRQGDTIWVESQKPQIFLYRFVDPLPFAAPPFLTKMNLPEGMEVDSMAVLAPRQPYVLSQKTLYFIQTDTTGNVGEGITAVSKDFPKLKVVNHIADAMVYISDDSEYQNMKKSTYKKKLMDEQWLNFGGTQNNTQKLIAAYFKRVSYANQHFTSIREGWRTDRGMIYIVFGEPIEVSEVFGQLTWTYFSASMQRRFSFTFAKVENPFSQNHYILQNRDSKFLPYWKLAVGSWRSGSEKSD
jgi:GWxTD domain-containing protein